MITSPLGGITSFRLAPSSERRARLLPSAVPTTDRCDAYPFTAVEGTCSVAPEATTMLLMMYDAPAFICSVAVPSPAAILEVGCHGVVYAITFLTPWATVLLFL